MRVSDPRRPPQHVDWGTRDTDPPKSDTPSDPPPKMKGKLSTAVSHFSDWASGLSKRGAALLALFGGLSTLFSIGFSFWTSQQKFFTQKQGELMLDALARIEGSLRAEQETRKGLQAKNDKQDDELQDHDRAITRLEALRNPSAVRTKTERIQGSPQP